MAIIKEKIFLISPVANVTAEIRQQIAAWVAQQETGGHQVHWPERDTAQNQDRIGTRICLTNGTAIKEATKIAIWYHPTSRGSMFDAGMAFILGKPLIIANPESLPHTSKKSLENVLIDWATHGNPFQKL